MGLDYPLGALGEPVVLPPPHQSTVNSMVVVLGVVPQGLWLPALAIAPDPLPRLSVGGAMSWTMSSARGAAVQS